MTDELEKELRGQLAVKTTLIGLLIEDNASMGADISHAAATVQAQHDEIERLRTRVTRLRLICDLPDED